MEEQPVYNLFKRYRGQAIIIVNKNFEINGEFDPKLKRIGSAYDKKKMKSLFKALDFKVKVYKDLSAARMKEKIEKASACAQNKESDCFVVVISTHGEEAEEKKIYEATVWKQFLLGSDGQKVMTEDIVKIVNDSKTLQDKPKLFFIQACRSRYPIRSERYDKGKDIQILVEKTAGSQTSDSMDYEDGVADMIDEMSLCAEGDIYHDWSDTDPDEWDGDIRSDEEDIAQDSRETSSMDANSDFTVTSQKRIFTTPSDAGDTIRHPADTADAGHSGDSGNLPGMPFDITGIQNLPKDCLLVYPVMFGRVAFRNKDIGSRMLHIMQREENMKMLIKGNNLLQYLTKVSSDLANVDITVQPNPNSDDKISVKANICVQHRLRDIVILRPKTNQSFMGRLHKKFFS